MEINAYQLFCSAPKGHDFKILSLISPIIDEVQRPGANIYNALQKIKKCYAKADKKGFSEVLWRTMIIVFPIPKGNENTDRVVKFFHRIVTSVGTEYENLALCIMYHREKRIPVRFRIVETIASILASFGTEYILPREIRELLIEVLLERIVDKHYSVRAQSAIALGFLRIPPKNLEAVQKISSALVYSLSSDPNPEVRKAALKSLPIEKSTIECLVQKVTDKNDSVKAAALFAISEKIPIRTFTIFQRECILQSSLTNPCVSVRNQGIIVLQKWLESCQGNLCALLQKLDVIEKEKLCYLVLDTLYQEPNADSFDSIDKSFFDGKFIPLESLTVERTLLWLFMFRKFYNDPYYKEKLMPDPNNIFLEIPVTDDSDTKKEKLHFMLRHVLLILKYLKLEEGGRCKMKEIIGLVFRSDHLSTIHIHVLVQLLHICFIDDKEEGLMSVVNSVLNESAEHFQFAESVPSLSEYQILNLKHDLATTMHSRHKRIKEKEIAVGQNDFVAAQAYHVEIADLLKREEDLKEKLKNCMGPVNNKLKENSENRKEQQYCPTALCISLSIIIAHIQATRYISTQVRHFYEHRVLKEMHKFADPRLRKNALKLMTLVGFQNFEQAEKSMILCIQGIVRDDSCVKVVSLKCMFDLILQYSFEEFEALPNVIQVFTGRENNLELSQRLSQVTLEEGLSPLRLLVISFMGSSEKELQNASVEGVIKLLLANKFHSPKVVETLLLLWTNPINAQTKVYKDVLRWLPIYANTGLTQGNLIANALIPCITKILSSPLSESSIESLASFVLQSTEPKKLGHINSKVHGLIAMNVLEEMMYHISSTRSIIFARILKQLDLQNCDSGSLSEMIKLGKFLSHDVSRQVRKITTEFIQYLISLGGRVDGNDSDADVAEHISDVESDTDAEPDSCCLPAAGSIRTEIGENSIIDVNQVFSDPESNEE